MEIQPNRMSWRFVLLRFRLMNQPLDALLDWHLGSRATLEERVVRVLQRAQMSNVHTPVWARTAVRDDLMLAPGFPGVAAIIFARQT